MTRRLRRRQIRSRRKRRADRRKAHEKMVQLAKRNPPPQSWYDEDFAGVADPIISPEDDDDFGDPPEPVVVHEQA